MNTGKTIFAQIMNFLPIHELRKCIKRYNGNYKVQSFSCLDQYLSMAFAQLTYRESLRDIESCLRAMRHRLYHMGIRSQVYRPTLAKANENRDWRIYADFAQVLINIARELYTDDPFEIDLKDTVYALDSTTIDLCLSLFSWARFRKKKGAIKIQTLLDLRGHIPAFIKITDGKTQDVKVLDDLIPEPGSFYVMDKGYTDFKRLHILKEHLAFFVIRAKENFKFRRIYSHPVDKSTGLLCDQIIRLTGPKTKTYYYDQLRRVCYHDPEIKKYFVFLTNNVNLPAITITHLYKCRWQVELFFKWIKQHLRIKAFYGTSENAVKTQIWIAISVYVLIAIIKKRLKMEQSLYTILQILSITVFEKLPILQVLTDIDRIKQVGDSHNQLTLFDL